MISHKQVSIIPGLEEFFNYSVTSHGKVMNLKTGRPLKGESGKKGHLRVMLSSGAKRARPLVHRLVALAYIQNPEGKPFVCHKDSNPKNNTVENLRWDDAHGNMRDRRDRGLYPTQRGESNYSAKLNLSEVFRILDMVLEKFTEAKIANYFNISRATVNDIKHGRSWSSFTSSHPYFS